MKWNIVNAQLRTVQFVLTVVAVVSILASTASFLYTYGWQALQLPSMSQVRTTPPALPDATIERLREQLNTPTPPPAPWQLPRNPFIAPRPPETPTPANISSNNPPLEVE